MDKTHCTLVLDAYTPQDNLAAVDGRLVIQGEFQNMTSARQRLYSQSLANGWGGLLTPYGRAGVSVTVYGDAFERRYFTAMEAYYRLVLKDVRQAFGPPEVKPLPTEVDPPLEARIAEAEQIFGTPLNLAKRVCVAVYGEFANEVHLDYLRKSIWASAKQTITPGLVAAIARGLKCDVVGVGSTAELVALSREVSLVAVIVPKGRESELLTADVTIEGNERGAMLVPVEASAPETIADDRSHAWFVWAIPTPEKAGKSALENVCQALMQFLEHGVAKARFAEEMFDGFYNRAQLTPKQLMRLIACRPVLQLNPPTQIERHQLATVDMHWSVPWSTAFPEIKTGFEPQVQVVDGLANLQLEGVDKWRGLEEGKAIVHYEWNAGVDKCTFEVAVVKSSIANAGEIHAVHPQEAICQTKADRLWANMIQGESIELVDEWTNAEGQILPALNEVPMVELVENKQVQRALPTCKREGDSVFIKTRDPGLFRVIYRRGTAKLTALLSVLPRPVGISSEIAPYGQTPADMVCVQTAGAHRIVYVAPEEAFSVRLTYQYDSATLAIVKQVLAHPGTTEAKEFMGFVPVLEERKGARFKVEKAEPGCYVCTALEAALKSGASHFVCLDAIAETEMFPNYTPVSGAKAEFDAEVVKDVAIVSTVVMLIATGLCVWLCRQGDYGLNAIRSGIYAAAILVELGLHFIPRINGARILQWGGIAGVLACFLYECWQELL